MELQFDKEMDAILRKARSGTGAAVRAETANHLDADAIAAFAENALPQKARSLYMEHFADCDDCRKQLSYTILANSEAVATPASNVVAAVETVVPWYSKLFRTPNLALAMGALVLTFGGILGYLAFQDRNGKTVSQVADKQIAKPSFSEPSTTANTSSAAANTMAPANMAASNMTANSAANVSESAPGRTDAKGVNGPSPSDSVVSTTDSYDEPAKPVAAAPPAPPKTAEKTDVVRDEQPADDNKSKVEDKDKEERLRRESENRIARESVPSAKKDVQRSATGPRNNNQQYNVDGADQMASGGMAAKTPAAIKTAGGKKFENRSGAWYDTAYHGQATVNVRRGTDEYRKLDGGLRSIADSVGGTVVVVWKGKAYRVQ